MNDLVGALQWLADPSSWSGSNGIAARTWEHIQYAVTACVVAVVIALALGLVIGHTGKGAFVGLSASGIARAIPTLGVVILVFRMAPLTVWPVIVALAVLAIPPILANTVAGIQSVDPAVRDAAEGMGMTGWEVLWKAEVPVAMPLILAGMRSAANQVIATATVAAYVGLGGLGRFIYDGYATRRYDIVYGGALLVIALVFIVEGLFALAQRILVSPGVTGRFRSTAALPLGLVPTTPTAVLAPPTPAGGTTT